MTMKLEPVIIGAPFGVYLHFKHTTPTIGTYTARYRGGFWKRVWRVLRTVRPYPRIGAWVNKLGLPNPGIDYLTERLRDAGFHELDRFEQSILSVMGHTLSDWERLFNAIRLLPCQPAAVEMNVSCPNCPGEDMTNYHWLLTRGIPAGLKNILIVKLPPIGYADIATWAMEGGIRSFHCCNTLPTPGGGLSGKPLKPFALEAVRNVQWLARNSGVTLEHVIGGGGITSMEDAAEYLAAGATNVAVASALFNPLNWSRIKFMATSLASSAAREYEKSGFSATEPMQAERSLLK